MHGNSTHSNADSRITDLMQAGQIRIGVFPSFQYSTDSITGEKGRLAIIIAHALSARLGLHNIEIVEYRTPLDVIEGLKSDKCDFGFMLIDPTRTAEVDFTPPFVQSDFTYLLPPGSQLNRAVDVDSPEIHIAAVRGHASTTALQRTIRQASIVYADAYDSAVGLLRSGDAEAFASIREIALRYAIQLPGSRVLNESHQSNFAGVAVAKEHPGRLSSITEFLDDLKRSGEMQQMVEAGLQRIKLILPHGAAASA